MKKKHLFLNKFLSKNLTSSLSDMIFEKNESILNENEDLSEIERYL